jgi:pimeloyl-ACP methyl ester carboxylesterase
MGYLAAAGYDVFSVDMEGYGRSARPPQMDDKCNLSPQQQLQFASHCAQTYPGALTNALSDWNDIGAAVAYIRKLRHVKKVNLVGWSQGGPRAGGWAAQHPDQVARLVLLAPAYNRNTRAQTPPLPVPGVVFNTQSRDEFIANWDRQAPCPGQYDPGAAAAVWEEMLASDPVGAKWSPPVRRAPIASSFGWTTQRVKAMRTPTLMISGVNDRQVLPERVRDFHADLGSPAKVFVDLGCSSHNAMWEKNHLLLFRASLEWLDKGTVNGRSQGVIRMGYGK